MDVHVAYRLFLILYLVSHGISVPVFSNYYDNTQNQGYQVSDDVTETDSYERFPRDVLDLSSPYFWQRKFNEYRWFPRSLIPSRPRQAHRRHYHLYHLTSKHPNAVSYHVIEKPHATRTINSRPHRVRNNINNHGAGQYQSYPAQSYYQQPYQYSGYPAGYDSSSPQTQYGIQNNGAVHDSTYDDILQQVSKPLDHPNQPLVGQHNARQNIEGSQNDQALTSIEEAAKQFKLASADMSNMELASLVMYPLPRFLVGNQPKTHKKKHKRKHKKNNKNVKAQKSELKVEDETNGVTNLVDKLMENGKGEKNGAHVDTTDKEKMEEDKEEDKGEKSGEHVDTKNKEKMEEDKDDDKEEKTGAHLDSKDKEKMDEDKEDDIIKGEKSGTHVDTKDKKKMEKDKEDDRKPKEDSEGDKQENSGKIKNVKNYEDDSMNDDDKDSMTSKDSWDEEDISPKGGDEYTSSKRSEIPHIIDEVSNSDEDKVETDESEDSHENDVTDDDA